MTQVRVGAVGYLNARPLVYGLDRQSRFNLRFDVPSECARLLHEGAIDLGLIPSIEYLRGGPYCIVPDLAIASQGPVASVALYSAKAMADVQSIAMDTSSRTSVALASVLCARLFKIRPRIEAYGPDLGDMLVHCDAALIIGDNALFLDPPALAAHGHASHGGQAIEKIDLGEAWTRMTGLPFVYAFWAGPPAALESADVTALQHARDEGVTRPDELAREYLVDAPARQKIGADYLRENISYYLRGEERAGLEAFYRYAAEAGVVSEAKPLRFY
jgi:predicted solute-binding protein